MRRIAAELLTVHRGLDLDADLVPVVAGPARRHRLRHGTVDELDGRLHHRRILPMGVPLTMDLLAVAPSGDLIAVTDDSAVHVLGAEGRSATVGVAGADAAHFVAGGLLLLTAPSRGGHAVTLADTATGRVLDRSPLGVDRPVVTLTPHPHDGSVVLDAGLGDAGSALFVVRVAVGTLAVERIGTDVYAGGFPPAGDRLLLLPHARTRDVSVVSWPDRHPVACLAPDRVGARFDECGCFLDGGRVLLRTFGSGLLLCSADLEPTAWLDLDLTPVVGAGDAELSRVVGLSPDTIAADVWDGGEPVPTVWWIHDRAARPALTGTDELSVRLARVAGKLDRARELDGPVMFGADSHHFWLGPPLPEDAVADFERAHAVPLPADYRAFLTRLGHGGPGGSPGAGPYYGLEPLDGPAPSGTLTLSHQGCGHYARLATSGPDRGRVTEDGTRTDDADFLAWYERWLDATLAGEKTF
ncbi:hypothetical protein GCM10009557_72350 [Virgisporangium ochraceum]